MIVAVSADPGMTRPTCAQAPLVVRGTVHGGSLEVLVTGLPEVLAQIGRWAMADPDAVGCWGLRHDYSESVVIPVRQRPGAVAESRRTAHVVRLSPGESHGGTLVAACGERLPLLAVDVLPLGVGMPCQACLLRTIMAGWDTTGFGSAGVDTAGLDTVGGPTDNALAG
jgi:hypothetical protein